MNPRLKAVRSLALVFSAAALSHACGMGDPTPPQLPSPPASQPGAIPSPSAIPVVCTQQFVYGVVSQVLDPSGNAISDATALLTEGPYSEPMQPVSPDQPGLFQGAGERPGTYQLTVSAPGFQTQQIPEIIVAAGVCHVMTVQRGVTLNPE